MKDDPPVLPFVVMVVFILALVGGGLAFLGMRHAAQVRMQRAVQSEQAAAMRVRAELERREGAAEREAHADKENASTSAPVEKR